VPIIKRFLAFTDSDNWTITEVWTAAGAGKGPSMDRTICQGSSADLARMVETLSSAFQHDPALSWIVPHPAQRQLRLPKLFDLVVRSDLAAGSALRSNAFEVVTLWRAPGKAHVGLVETLLSGLGYFSNFWCCTGSRQSRLTRDGIEPPQRRQLLVPALCRRASGASG
jgi:hypothetical protein